jgi:DNA-binding transcriptional LysR family regulator
MELRQVKYFLALSRELNFTRAAERSNVTQPTLTAAIKKLEEELGGPLVHRERNRTHLTQLGQMVLPFLEQVYESSNAARSLAQDLQSGDRVPLSLGVSDAIDKSRLLKPIREVRAAAEGLELHVEGGADSQLAARLLDGGLDMALLDVAAAMDEKFRLTPLYTEDMVILMAEADPLASRSALGLQDFMDRHWIGLIGSRVHAEFAMMARDADPDWTQRHRASRPTEAQVLTLSGLGLALAGDYEPIMPGLVIRPLQEPMLTRTVGIAEIRGRRCSSAALALTRLLRAQTYEATARTPTNEA